MSTKVIECRSDMRKLYSLVNGLIGLTSQNPLQDNRSNDELVEEYIEFFMSKIRKICEELNDYPKYKPVSNNPPQLDQFEEISEEEVLRIINSMGAKTCSSDPVPTAVLKDLAPFIIRQITTIVNVSLKEGVFANK